MPTGTEKPRQQELTLDLLALQHEPPRSAMLVRKLKRLFQTPLKPAAIKRIGCNQRVLIQFQVRPERRWRAPLLDAHATS